MDLFENKNINKKHMALEQQKTSPNTDLDSDRGLKNYLEAHRGVLSVDGINRAYAMLEKTKGQLNFNNQVAALQGLLLEAGFDPGKIDGLWGEKTSLALLNFQRAEKVSATFVTGKMNDETYKALLAKKQELLKNAEGRTEKEMPLTKEEILKQSAKKYEEGMSHIDKLLEDAGVRQFPEGQHISGVIDNDMLDQHDAKAEGYEDVEAFRVQKEADALATELEAKAEAAKKKYEKLQKKKAVDDKAVTYGQLASAGDEMDQAVEAAQTARQEAEGLKPEKEGVITSKITKLTESQISAGFYYDKNSHIHNSNYPNRSYYEDTKGHIVEDISARPKEETINFGTRVVSRPRDFQMYFRPQQKFWTENGFYVTSRDSPYGMLRRMDFDKGRPDRGYYDLSQKGDLIHRGQGIPTKILDRDFVKSEDFFVGNWKEIEDQDVQKYISSNNFRSKFREQA